MRWWFRRRLLRDDPKVDGMLALDRNMYLEQLADDSLGMIESENTTHGQRTQWLKKFKKFDPKPPQRVLLDSGLPASSYIEERLVF